jgi:hypothetical protein
LAADFQPRRLDRAATALFDCYNHRQRIEAFFKASKHVFGMANLRSRRFPAIADFLGFCPAVQLPLPYNPRL